MVVSHDNSDRPMPERFPEDISWMSEGLGLGANGDNALSEKLVPDVEHEHGKPLLRFPH
jgi:hypothetical protein